MAKPFSGNLPIRVLPALWQEDINVPVTGGQQITPGNIKPQNYLNIAKPAWGFKLSIRFHVRYAVGGTAQGTAPTLNTEFPLGFIDRLGVSGISRYFGNQKRFRDFNHCTFWTIMNMLSNNPQRCIVSRNGAAYQQVQGNGSSQVANPTNTINTNTDYDVIVESTVPFVPLFGIQRDVVMKQQAPFMFREGSPAEQAAGGKIWRNVELVLSMADFSGLFDNVDLTKSTITFGQLQGTNKAGGTAAASGSPLITLSMLPVMFGDSEDSGEAGALAAQVGKGLLFQQEQTIQAAVLTASVANPTILQRLSVTNPHYARLFIKTGNSPVSTPSNGVQSVVQTPNDAIFTHVEIRRNKKPIRFGDNIDIFNAKEEFARKYDTVIPAGYLPVDFLHGFDLNSAVDVSLLTSDNWTLNGASAGAASQIGEVLEESFITAP